ESTNLSGTTSTKAKNISKNCSKADCSWDGIEAVFHQFWAERTQGTRRSPKAKNNFQTESERRCMGRL
ncbi:hypothetical protein QVD17_24018, partial [Tagetes erecta]